MADSQGAGSSKGGFDRDLYDHYSERASAFVKAFEAAIQHGVGASRDQLRKAADDLMRAIARVVLESSPTANENASDAMTRPAAKSHSRRRRSKLT
jgi:hypothetical protein